MTVDSQRMTATEFLALPEVQAGAWMELVNGEVIMSPRPNRYHSHAGIALARILDTHIQAHQLGILYSELDTVFDEEMVRVPDLLYYGPQHVIPDADEPNDIIPDLCIEILSPSNARTDRVEKFQLYEAKGVKFYWMVDPEEHTIEAYALEGGRYVCAGRGAGEQIVKLPPFPALDVPLAQLWHPKRKAGQS